ncbi:MAG: helix-turn-helix transcriptional regulator [Chitinophagaceae bacterium]|nr:helix-turn-helix transcriptional regulator [Chitinophagaceae bacterium]MCW5915061.1 helix-turn-helix transcriptional regulator [Chitinophagaceae bacterium]MCZ2396668.1 AraC family transcriptional regulator [Chitinophagales bacterium]
MPAHSLTPHPALRPYIQNYLYFEVGETDQWARVETSPTVLPVMAFSLESDALQFREYGKFEPLTFGGQITRFTRMHCWGRVKMFYIFFHPTGAYSLLGVPMKEMNNIFLSLSDLLGPQVRELIERLQEQKSIMGVKQILEEFLLNCLACRKQKENAIHLSHTIEQLRIHSHQRNIIKSICRNHGYSISRLERHAREMIGIGPKMIQRIGRFHGVLNYINQHLPPYKWAQIAFQFGYYDQMHFIKEFCWFYGTSPGELEKYSGKLNLSLNFTEEIDSPKSFLRVFK